MAGSQHAARPAGARPGALDDRSLVDQLDPHGLLARIEELPDQCGDAWNAARSFRPPDGFADARQLVVLGMGGSAIGGDILAAIAVVSGRKPVSVVRGYDAPPFVGSDALVVACSHSGETEETLAAFEDALARGARVSAVTTGGALAARAQQLGLPLLRYAYDGEPRSALGHQLMRLLALAECAGAIPKQDAAVSEALRLTQDARIRFSFDVSAERNPPKQLAARLHGRLPVVVGAGPLSAAARRWKTQFNENAKTWALHEELPELDHNAVEGFALPPAAAALAHAVFLGHGALDERLRRRYDATAAELDRAGVSHERVDASGDGPLALALTAVYLGDLTSYYLGLLNGASPSRVEAIDRLKAQLSAG